MKKSILPTAAIPHVAIPLATVALLLFSPALSLAQPASGKGNTPETYMVIQITDTNKKTDKIEYKVLATSQIKDEEKRVKDDYDKLVDDWKDLIKTDSNTPHPQRIVIKRLKQGYHSQQIAQEYVDKLKHALAGKTDTTKPQDDKQ